MVFTIKPPLTLLESLESIPYTYAIYSHIKIELS
jgi:hypothetical protein